MIRRLKTFAILAGLLSVSCAPNEYYAGPVAPVLPAHVRKITVRPIVRRVETPGHNIVGWEEKLRLRIQDELIRDGRFNYVNDEAEADGVLFAEITRLIFEPLSYDGNNVVQEIKLWVVLDIGFLDRVQDQVLWEEPNLEQEFLYFVSTQPGGFTDEEARDELWDRFARDVVKRIVEGFGSVTGASERKISAPPPQKPAPAPIRREAPPSPY